MYSLEKKMLPLSRPPAGVSGRESLNFRPEQPFKDELYCWKYNYVCMYVCVCVCVCVCVVCVCVCVCMYVCLYVCMYVYESRLEILLWYSGVKTSCYYLCVTFRSVMTTDVSTGRPSHTHNT